MCGEVPGRQEVNRLRAGVLDLARRIAHVQVGRSTNGKRMGKNGKMAKIHEVPEFFGESDSMFSFLLILLN